MIKNVQELEKILKVKLNEKQRKVFYRKESYLLWGGSTSSGKSFLLSFMAMFYALRFEGSVSLIGRKFQSSLAKTTQVSFENLLNKLPKGFLKRKDKTFGYFEFKNHSRVYFVGLSDSHDSLQKLQGIEAIFIGVDEAQDFDSDKEFLFLTTRLRQKIEGAKRKILLTCNPTREKWITDRWFGRKAKDFCLLRALPKDNKDNLPAGYLGDQKRVLPPLLYRILIKGSWEDAQIENCLFKQEEIEEARGRKDYKPGKVSYGIDVSLKGMTIVAKKEGNRITLPIVLRGCSIEEFMKEIEGEVRHKSLPIYVDGIGEGAGICVVLEREKYNIKRVIQSESALDRDKYYNLRSENYDRLNFMLNELILPNDQELINQMLNCKKDVSREGKIKLETKADLHRRNESPDKLDAIVLSVSGEGREEEEYSEDERGIYEVENGKKVYLINYSINISQMVNKGLIGRYEIAYDPEQLTPEEERNLRYVGHIREGWRERRKEFMLYVEKYARTGKEMEWIKGLKYRY